MDLVIFDLDGTLIDSAAIILAAQVESFARHGLVHPGREAGLGVVGLTLDIALMRLAGLSAPDDGLTETYRTVFNAMRTAADPALAEPVYPGVDAMLRELASWPDTALAIATGKSRRGADYIVERHGWRGLFAVVQSADDAPSKPHPGMIRNAVAAVAADINHTAMIGDSSFDMAMAVSAGVWPIAVSWGFQTVEALSLAGADAVIDDCAGLPPLLRARWHATG